MRIRIERHGLVPAIIVTIVGVVVLYLASTWGWATLRGGAAAASSGTPTLPQVVERPPASVATTGEYGPIGSVSMAYAGTDVDSGLFGTVDPVWMLVSAHDGDTRALSVDGLPEPGARALSVSPAGDRLAWLDDDGVEVYDTVTDEVESLTEEGVSAVGPFSPDGSSLLLYADGLVVLDLTSGDSVSRFEADPATLGRAAWRADSSAVDFVSGNQLVTGAVPGSEVSRQPTDIPERSQLAWSPAGDRLASLQQGSASNKLFASELTADDRVGPATQVPTPQISLDRLVGFTGRDSVATVSFALDTGAVERVLDIPLAGGSPSDLTTLPGPGENWAGTDTLAIATDTLPFGSTDFEEHVWPWSYAARLVGCILVGVFLLGLFVTRRPR